MPSELHVESIAPDRFTAADARLIAELLCTVWPKPGRTVKTRVDAMLEEIESSTTEMAPRSFLVRDERKVIAFAAMLPRTIGTTAGRITIAGLARVCTHPEHRGRGLGELVARAAFELVDNGDFPWSLYQTTYPVQPFYEKLGAALVRNRIINSRGEDPESNPFWDEVIMRYPAHGEWPSGTIDLLGPGY